MADPIGLVAVLGTFGIPLYWIKMRAEERRRKHELAVGKAGGGGPEAKLLLEENKLLRERVENLETIVCSVDFELNKKIAKLVDDQRSLILPPASPGPAAPGLDKTATAAGPRAPAAPAPVSAAFESGQVVAQRYRIQRCIGQGGMGAVYLADDEVLGELVALKVITCSHTSDEPAMVARFRREAAAARKVSSPSVIRIHDLGEARPGLLYLSMEYFNGRTLAEMIAQRGQVPIKDAQDILQQICAGLEAAHAAGVIHRDLKPSNVLVGERGAVKIIDFGLATTLVGESLTATGAILGTPHYMAPEQVRGKPVDARTDIYALGALAYHLIVGRPPFGGDNAIAIGFAHLSETPPRPRELRKEVSTALDDAIMAALEKSPEQRPSSARAFCERAFAASAA
jgi:serine/threonine-protein kinase